MSGESLESLLEFLTISGRVAVVQLEPPRARAFAEALRASIADEHEVVVAAIGLAQRTERNVCAEICEREAEILRPMVGTTPEHAAALRCARRIRARSGPVAHEGSPSLVEASE